MKDKIIILGSGESGVGAAKLAQKQGMEVFVSDFGTIKQAYKDELIALNIPFEEGKHTEEIILSATTVIKSPGIADKVAIIQKIKEKQIPVISEIEFGFRFSKAKIIAITGTNGKTTTTSLTYHILEKAGLEVSNWIIAPHLSRSFPSCAISRKIIWTDTITNSRIISDLNSVLLKIRTQTIISSIVRMML